MPEDLQEDPVLNAYYEDLSKVTIFTREHEKELFIEYQETHNAQIRQLLIESCLKLVFSLARRYWLDKDSHTLQALISAGNLGLIEAVEKFDPHKGARFASYASFWILKHVRNELSCFKDVVQPSAKERKLRMRSAESRKRLLGNAERQAPASYQPIDCATEQELYWLKHPNMYDLPGQETVVSTDIRRLFTRWFRFLTVREQFVLRAYYGLINNGESLKLRQIADYLGLSSERIRQIKVAALEKLRRWLSYDGILELDDVL